MSLSSRSLTGRLFHSRGPATPKLLSPSLDCVRGTVHVWNRTTWHVSSCRPHCRRVPMFCYPTDNGWSSSGRLSLLRQNSLAYLNDLLREYQFTRTLWFFTAHLHQPSASTLFASHSFSVASPAVWNKLSTNAKTATTLGLFKS